jgi:hypothetical protein
MKRRAITNDKPLGWDESTGESRSWPFGAALLAVLCGAAGLWYADMVDKARITIETARLRLDHTRRSLAAKQQRAAARNDERQQSELPQQQLHLAETRLAEASRRRDATAARKQTILAELRSLVAAMEQAAQRAEDAWRRIEIPELHLASGKVLRNVKLGGNDGTRWNLTHSEGAGSVLLQEMPSSLPSELDATSVSLLHRLRNFESRIDPKEQDHAEDTSTVQLVRVRKEIDLLQAALERLTVQRLQQEALVREYEHKITLGANLAQPTFNLRTERDIAEGNAGQVRSEISRIEARLGKMKTDEQALLKSKQ